MDATQLQAMLSEATKLLDMTQSASTPLLTQAELVRDEIEDDDARPETTAQQAAVDAYNTALSGLYDAARGIIQSFHPSMAVVAGAPTTDNQDKNLAAFKDYLMSSGERFQTLYQSPASKTPAYSAGTNVGTGLVRMLNMDANGQTIDLGHPEVKALTCTQDSFHGAVARNAIFTIAGEEVALYSYQDGGSGSSDSYTPAVGQGLTDFGPGASVGRTTMQSVSGIGAGTGPGNNAIQNGAFTQPLGVGVNKLAGFTITNGDANVTLGGTNAISTQSVELTGAAVFEQLLGNRIRTGTGISVNLMVDVSGPLSAGTVVTRIVDDDGTLFSASLTLSASTPGTWANTGGAFFLKRDVEGDLIAEVTYTPPVSGTPTVYLDEFTVTEMYFYDSEFIAIHTGELDYRLNDTFVATAGNILSGSQGRLQNAMNRVFGDYMPHSASAVFWAD